LGFKVNVISKTWRNWNLGRAYAGDARAMNRLYCLRDPWKLDGPDERFRFAETTRIIKDQIGNHFESIIELGCGEGLQTGDLCDLATRIIGVDVSARAIKRARARQIPNASFQVGNLNTWNSEECDLVLACEILYYLDDLEAAYHRLTTLGRWSLVTYHRGAFDRLDPFFASKPVRRETIKNENCEWRVVYWQRN